MHDDIHISCLVDHVLVLLIASMPCWLSKPTPPSASGVWRPLPPVLRPRGPPWPDEAYGVCARHLGLHERCQQAWTPQRCHGGNPQGPAEGGLLSSKLTLEYSN